MSKPVPRIRLDPRTGLPSVDTCNQKRCDTLPKNDEKQQGNTIVLAATVWVLTTR